VLVYIILHDGPPNQQSRINLSVTREWESSIHTKLSIVLFEMIEFVLTPLRIIGWNRLLAGQDCQKALLGGIVKVLICRTSKYRNRKFGGFCPSKYRPFLVLIFFPAISLITTAVLRSAGAVLPRSYSHW